MPFVSRLPCAIRLLPLIAGLVASGIARADDDPSPYYIGASERVIRESNVYRVPESANAQSDTLYTTSLLAGIDQPFGRERLFGNVALRDTRYGSQKSLNNNGYDATLGLNWATINRLSGNFTYTGSRDLALLNADSNTNSKAANFETSHQFDATARLGLVTRLTAVLNYNYRKLDYSDDLYRYRNFDQNALSLGMNYSTSSALTLGASVKHSEGKYPTYSNNPFAENATFFKDDYKRNDFSLTSQWIPSGASSLNARLSFSKEDHDAFQARSFNGTTGYLSWDWRPTGKLRFVTSAWRDTGQQSTFYERSINTNTNVTGDNSQVTSALQVTGRYELSAKVSIDATLRGLQRSLSNNAPNAAEVSGRDRTTVAKLGAKWQALRTVDVGCDVGTERRTSDILALSQPYSSNSFGCYGRIQLEL